MRTIQSGSAGETYDRNVDLPTPASPRRRMGISGASSHAIELAMM